MLVHVAMYETQVELRLWSAAECMYIRRAQNSDIGTDLVFRMGMDVATWMLMLHSVCLKKPWLRSVWKIVAVYRCSRTTQCMPFPFVGCQLLIHLPGIFKLSSICPLVSCCKPFLLKAIAPVHSIPPMPRPYAVTIWCRRALI